MHNTAKSFSRYLASGFLALFTTLNLAQAAEFSDTLPAAPGGQLNLRTDVGSLNIDTHNDDTVVYRVEVQGIDEDDFTVTSESNGGDVEIIGKYRQKKRWGYSGRVRFYVSVPREYSVKLHTSGGSIDIKDLLGDVDAKTSGGSIAVGNITGDVDLHTSGGSITSEAIAGHLDAHTSGGSINVTISEPLQQDAKLHTSGGSITARINADSQLSLDASTSGGRVKTDFAVDGKVKKRAIRGDINGGGPTLKLRTSGGSISIQSL